MTEAPDFKLLQHVTKIMLMRAENNLAFLLFPEPVLTFPLTCSTVRDTMGSYQCSANEHHAFHRLWSATKVGGTGLATNTWWPVDGAIAL